MKRVGVIGIIVSGERGAAAAEVQHVLSQYAEIIVGRQGIPFRDREISAISLIVEGELNEITALSSRLGQLKDVQVKSAVV